MQFALVMAACALATVAISNGGLAIFSEWQTYYFLDQLSPEAGQAREDIEAGRTPGFNELTALQAEASRFNPEMDRGQHLALAVLSVLATAIGVTASFYMALRLVRPLEDVASAARRLSAGDLSARAPTRPGSAGEIGQLVDDFNLMASALEVSERELQISTASIAHELRTPLTILRGRLQGMLDGVFASGEKEVRGLVLQVDQLGRIVDDLQLLSLAATGELYLQKGRVDLAEEVESVITTVRPDFDAAGMCIELDLRPALVIADAARLRQAMLALLDNCRRHAASGGVVRIETARFGEEAILRVLDRGPGLSDEAHARVFERFWRADRFRKGGLGGSGLGLSVVQAIAEAQGGRVRALTRDAGGAMFEIVLPSI